MTSEERKKAQMALAHLSEKKSGEVKGHIACNGAPTRKCVEDVDTSSPTASLESTILTAVMDACEGRDVMSSDIPNAFIQAPFPEKEGEETAFMKTTCPSVGTPVGMHPEEHEEFVVCENDEPALHAETLGAPCGMLESALS